MTSGTNGFLQFAALLSAILLLPTLGVTQEQTKAGERAIQARQGFMQIQLSEAGPLFGMAKGDVAYDAETASANAENLNALVQYDLPRLFVPDTSKSVYSGKTRALAKIWDEPDAFADAFQSLREKVAVLRKEAGNGKDALTAAVGELGKACGNCHNNFRAKEF